MTNYLDMDLAEAAFPVYSQSNKKYPVQNNGVK